jgi:hypothetical protein
MSERIRGWLQPLLFLGTNPITLVGAVLTTSAAVTVVGALILELMRGRPFHPYAGIILFLILPGLFVLGLLLIPIGAGWRRRRLRAKGELPAEYPPLDFRGSMRRGGALVLGATFLNVAILSAASYQGVEYMDSNEFCGVACHSVMAPEYAAFKVAAHSQVGCVDCHIGPGATSFVRAKVSGTRQLVTLARGTQPRPIPAPVRHMRPASEICERCHAPQKHHGDKVVVRTRYASDEANTALTTVMVLKIGGPGVGIHGLHLDPARPISYVAADDRRQVIPRVTRGGEGAVEYVSKDVQADVAGPASGRGRAMDCMDCHNRPSHTFEVPERAVDEALAAGRISPALPFVKKKAVELLRAEYADQAAALAGIDEGLAGFYRTSYPEVFQKERARIEAAAKQVGAIHARNVFPGMKVTWGTYPNNIGHEDFPGCFRCHDDNHQAPDGRTITQGCDSCHTILAQDEKEPKVLSDLGLR